MDVASVTLDEVLKAAQLRAASLVPETSGYLALAIADASARLPFRIEDDMVNLSTEGSVKVMRGTEVVQPEESAAVMRDVLDRLLGCSIGSMPGLASASRARTDRETVLDVIGDLESALVPVNRSAARRALARLARETVRARERGKLDRPVRSRPKSARPPARHSAEAVAPAPAPILPAPTTPMVAPAATVPAQVVAPAAVAEPLPIDLAPVVVAPVVVAPRAATPPTAVAASELQRPEVPHPAPPAPIEVDVVFTEPPTPVEPMASAEPTPTIVASTVEDELVDERLEDAPIHVRVARAPETSGPTEAEGPPGRPRHRRERRSDEAQLEMKTSSVDQLLAQFQVSKLDVPADAEDTSATAATPAAVVARPSPSPRFFGGVKERAPAGPDGGPTPHRVAATDRAAATDGHLPSPSDTPRTPPPTATVPRAAEPAGATASRAAAAPPRGARAVAAAARASLAPVIDTETSDVPDPSGAIAIVEPAQAPRFGARHIAFLVAALVVAALLGHYAPRMF